MRVPWISSLISEATKAISSKQIGDALDRLDRAVKEVKSRRDEPSAQRDSRRDDRTPAHS